MRPIKAALVALLLAGCGQPEQLPTAWTISGDQPVHTEMAIEVAAEQAPCPNLGPWGGTVQFSTDLLQYNGQDLASGLAWSDSEGPHVQVYVASPDLDARETSLVHELGHIIFDRCGKPSWVNGQHTMEFLAWVSWTNFALLGRELGK